MVLPRWNPLAAAIISLLGSITLLLWLLGIALHDATAWSQWLSWIPAPAVALALGLASAFLHWLQGRERRRTTVLFALGSVAALGWTLHLNVGWAAPPAGLDRAVRLLQWNTDWPSADDPRSAQAMASHPADIVLNSNHGDIMRPPMFAGWSPRGTRAYMAGPFAVVTGWQVLEAREVAAGGWGRQMWFVAKFVVMPPGWAGRPLRIAMVDLPSRPTLPRHLVEQAVLQGCERGDLGEVDIVAGDFNAIDGSVILQRCFPTFRDALAEAGRGWLGTWPRTFPLWKIDHVLLAPGMRAVQATVHDPGTSHHRMTIVDVEPR